MTARKALSKKTRFEVFKRDEFTCQYCGAHPPEVVLHVDHVVPVAEGGDNANDNLVTACESCNLGKGARSLNAVPEPLLNRAEGAREREDQLVGYQNLLRERQRRIEDESWEIAEILEPGSQKHGFDRRDLISIKRFLEKLGFDQVRQAAEIAYLRKPHSAHQRFKYFCGTCWGMIREAQDARP